MKISSQYNWINQDGMLHFELDERHGAERDKTIYDKSGIDIVREKFKKTEREYADPQFDRAVVWVRYCTTIGSMRIDFDVTSSQILFKIKSDADPEEVRKIIMGELMKAFCSNIALFEEFLKHLREKGYKAGEESMRGSFVNLLFPDGFPSEGNSHS